MRRVAAILGSICLGLVLARADGSEPTKEPASQPAVFLHRPNRRVPASLEPALRHLKAGTDAFPEEKDAEELARRLDELRRLLIESPRRAAEAGEWLLDPDFKGSRLALPEETLTEGPYFEAFRSREPAQGPERDRRAFGEDIARLVEGMDELRVAEFQITSIVVQEAPSVSARTEVRYDLVGSSRDSWRVQRSGRWRIDWRRAPDGVWRIVGWAPLSQSRSRASAPVFTEVTDAALASNASFRQQLTRGLDEWLARLDAVFLAGGMGHHGVSVGDADGDGHDDLYVAQPAGLPNRLYRNRGDGTFTDVTEAAGVSVLDSTSQSLFADVDNDGDQDLVLVTRTGLLLLANDGQGRFEEVRDAFRFKRTLRGSPTSVAMADYDRDGFLDLYLCTYAFFIGASEDKAGTPTPYHDAQNGPPNVLLRNDGRGRFLDVTDEVGLDQNNDRFSFAAAWADYDADGWPDLLVANDFGRKNLYRNLGAGGKVVFEDMASRAGVEDYGAGMSAAFFDYDNDGHLDIYTGNMWTAAGQRVTAEPGFKAESPAGIRDLYARHARGNSLFRNLGDGTFEDVTLAAGAEMGRWAWSSDAIDFDNDGFEDLYVVNGMFTRSPGEEDLDLDSFFWRQVTARSPLDEQRGTSFDDAWRATNRLLAENASQARHERNVFLWNDGRGGFLDVSGSVGLDLDQDGRSFAVVDFDHDGDLDVVLMAARSSPQLRVFRNDFRGRQASLALRLTGKAGNRDAVGARVTVTTDLLRRTKIVQAGSGFISQHSKELLFGLGNSRRIRTVEIQWPGGAVQTLTDVPLNQRVQVEEGLDATRRQPFRNADPPRANRAATVAPADDVPASGGTWLYRPIVAPDFSVRDLKGKEHSVASLRGKPALLLFWSLTAPPSRQALEQMSAHGPSFAAAGVPVLAISVDPVGEEAMVREATTGAVFPVILAGDEMAGTYSVLSRYLFDRREDLRLPTLLLLNERGEVAKVYRDRIVAASVLADLPRIDATPSGRLSRATPFAGWFHTPPAERSLFQYSLDLAEQGYEKASLAGFRRVAREDPSAIAFYNLGTLSMNGGQPTEARQAFLRALEMQPDHAEASNSLGALLAQSGDVPGAIARFRAALATRPQFPDALNNLGYALFQSEKDQEAYALYQEALAAQPDFPEALNNLGIFFGQQGDLDQAEAYFKRAVAARPGYGEASNNLALVLAARGDVSGAIALLQRFLEIEPGFEPSYVTLAKVYLGAGRRREGVQVLELLLQRNPRNAAALAMLAQLKAAR